MRQIRGEWIYQAKNLIPVFLGMVVYLLWRGQALAQPDTIWTKTFGGAYGDWGYSVCQTPDRGFIIAGTTASFGAGVNDVYLIRTDSTGDAIWTKTFGGPFWDYGYSVSQTIDGGFIITGRTMSFGAGQYDVYLIRTNSDGDTIWTKTFGGTDHDWGFSVSQTADGGFIITGRTWSFGAGSEDVYLIRINSSGDTLWTRTFGGPSSDGGYSVCLTTDGGFIIAGRTASFGADSFDVYLIRTNSNGDTLWTRTFGGTYEDWGHSVSQTADGGFIIAGRTKSFGAGSYDVYLIRTNSSGDTLWTRTFGGTYEDWSASVCQTTDGGFIIAGITKSFGAGSEDVYLIRTNSTGDTLWTKTVGGTGWDVGLSVYQTTDGGFIITGYTFTPMSDVYLIRLGPEPAVEESEQSSDTRWRVTTNAYLMFPGICIEYTLPAEMEVSLKLYNITGTCIKKLSQGQQSQGKHKVYWDGKADNGKMVGTGIYFYSLSTNKLGQKTQPTLGGAGNNLRTTNKFILLTR